MQSRAPQGARGLKFRLPFTRGRLSISRAPQGARGLKYNHIKTKVNATGRAPQGARGLKYVQSVTCYLLHQSRPARGAWVEIKVVRMQTLLTPVAPRKGRVG